MSDEERLNRVLIVDDSPDALRFLTEAMEEMGVEALLAVNGAAALGILERTRPDLILMDAVMPGMDGFEVTRLIKQNPATAQIPIIFMTGLTEPRHAIKALEAGGTDYVRKPLNLDELFARVGVHLANARAAQRNSTALGVLQQSLVAVDTRGSIIWATREARELLEYLTEGDTEVIALPADFTAALPRLIEAHPPPGQSTRVEIDGGAVEMHLMEVVSEDEILLKLVDAREDALVAQLQERHALTRREAEVLLWVSYGKPNRVISEILGISPRTVNKHLEQVFAKLGVETRAAAAAIAVKATTR